MKILLLDIETAPNIANVWGMWTENISMDKIVAKGYVLSWAAKWLGERTVHYADVRGRGGEKAMLTEIHDLLDQADVVVHYNGKSFDIPTLNKEFITHGMKPPAPYKQVDLLLAVRRQFRFPHNKLDYVCQALGLGSKVRHPGFQLWIDCMAGKVQAWNKMKRYNKRDVTLLEKLYMRVLPWIPNHPNHGAFSGKPACPSCGGSHVQARGTAVTRDNKYQRYQCLDCGTWSRAKQKLDKGAPKTLQGVA
jgi:DNA polymerase elongation subunit (family B)